MKFGKTIRYLRRAKRGRNILLTGVPRSGTTLTSRLLSEAPDTVALNEPLAQEYFPSATIAQRNIMQQCESFRKSIYFDGRAPARTTQGKITDNAYSPTLSGNTRKRIVERTLLSFDKKLAPDFTLILKHCAEFSLLLPALEKEIEVFAQIRNPLAVLASWQTVNIPVSRGKVAKSARLNASFHQALEEQGDDLLKRQLFILDWYYQRYLGFPTSHIIRYEQLIAEPQTTLTAITPAAEAHSYAPLQLQNNNPMYRELPIAELAAALLNAGGAYLHFYHKNDILTLAQELQSHGKQ